MLFQFDYFSHFLYFDCHFIINFTIVNTTCDLFIDFVFLMLNRYSILTEYLPAERLKNDFEAVRSTLIWRMDSWPGGRGLDPITDSTEYSCRSSGNEVGPPVSESIMNFSVECMPNIIFNIHSINF